MTSGADLFVVCKQCGSEVSPYITECPYCGHRLRRRAPKLPPANAPARTTLRARARALLSRSRPVSAGGATRTRVRRGPGRWAADRPHATIALVAASAVMWVLAHAEPALYAHTAILGPLRGDWWKLFTNAFAYTDGLYAFVAILTVAIFGWLVELRHGPAVVLALFFGATAAGALVAGAVYPFPVVSGANAAALALLAAWAVPDLESAREGGYRDGDLLGAGALAALLLAIPFARPEASWLAGVTGAVLGLLVGLGMHRLGRAEA
ncbi:MAG TPA: rhomboid family intramembrane serine protease [Solirubrobacteraceae bacterium]|nr:rhomboid family intramembrane serine protease [Solirubrobacteraceae bacterium]